MLRGPGAACRGDFTDTIHAVNPLVLHGHTQGSAVVLFCTYPAGDGSPDFGYRALAVREGDDVIWFWIGSHADCGRLLATL